MLYNKIFDFKLEFKIYSAKLISKLVEISNQIYKELNKTLLRNMMAMLLKSKI